jgi:hypothetical protein
MMLAGYQHQRGLTTVGLGVDICAFFQEELDIVRASRGRRGEQEGFFRGLLFLGRGRSSSRATISSLT